MDNLSRGWRSQLGLYNCHEGGGNQFFAFAKSGEIITVVEENCVGAKDDMVVGVGCSKNDTSQLWNYVPKVLFFSSKSL